MKTFRNIHFTKRDYECTNVVACQAKEAPNANWAPCSDEVLNGLTRLSKVIDSAHPEGIQYWGYL